MYPAQAPAFTPPLHSRFKRVLRSAVVSAASFIKIGLADFFSVFFFAAGVLFPVAADADFVDTGFTKVCDASAVDANVATQNSDAKIAPDGFKKVCMALLGSLNFQATFGLVVGRGIDWQTKTFAGPGTKVMALAALTAKRSASVAGRIQTRAFAGRAHHHLGS